MGTEDDTLQGGDSSSITTDSLNLDHVAVLAVRQYEWGLEFTNRCLLRLEMVLLFP